MNWENLLKVYENMGVEDIIPIAHTKNFTTYKGIAR